MRVITGLLMGLLAVVAHAEHYGAPITLKSVLSLDDAVARLDSKPADNVLIESKVGKVCEMKGCWLGLRSESTALHVTFRNEAFYVPPSLMGKIVRVEGRIEKVIMTLEETRDAIKQSGGDPSKVTKAGTYYSMVASGLEVQG